MALPVEAIQPGKVYQFKHAQRRVLKIEGYGNVHWEYADGQKRGGKTGGMQWIHYFRSDAKSIVGEKAEPTYAELKRRVEDLEAGIRAYLSGDYPNRRDNRPSKCKHGTNYWEPCAQCDTEHFEKLLDGRERG